jgi:hypothetical protein
MPAREVPICGTSGLRRQNAIVYHIKDDENPAIQDYKSRSCLPTADSGFPLNTPLRV